MPAWLAAVLEIVKIAVPALIVYFTVAKLFGDHLRTTERIRAQERRASIAAEVLPTRLQAYERLSLFCERISIPNLIMRLREGEQTAGALKLSLYLAVQQEYEHNIAQQVYMSQQLWDIIRQARDNSLQAIESVSAEVPEEAPSGELARALLAQATDSSNAGLAVALAAIKKEASLIYE